MLRYRRYRVFILIALAVTFAVYQFGQNPEWDAQADYATQMLRQRLGLRAGSSETAIGEEFSRQKEESAQLPMQYDHKDAADLPPNTGNMARPATDKLPSGAVPEKGPTHDDSDEWKPNPGASLPDKSKEREKDVADRQRVQPGGTEPISDDYVRAESGQGRKEADLTGGLTDLHFSKVPERFPVSSTIALPAETPKALPKVQHVFPADDKDGKADADKLAQIKAAFTHAWKGYKLKAFGQDEIRPVTGTFRNPFNAWGATLVDSLDSLWIMGMTDEFEDALKYVRDIDFTTTPRADIPVFETTIRYLGGLLAAYDVSGAKYTVLLDKAKELGDVLYAAFDTPNRMPLLFFHWKPAFASQIHRASTHVVMSEIGSLSMEFTRLAQLTKDNKYYDAIARITNNFQQWQNHTRAPGLWPAYLDASGCERISTTTSTTQKIGDNTVERLSGPDTAGKVAVDTKDGAKMVPVSQPTPPKPASEATQGGAASGGDTQKEFIPLKAPEPIVFTSGPQAGKVAQIQVIDSAAGATHGDEKEGVTTDPRQATDAAAALARDGDVAATGGKVGQVKQVEVGADGKERSRTPAKNTDRDTTGRVEDSVDPMDAAVAGMYARGAVSHEKRRLVKRQVLSHKEDEGPLGTIPVPPQDNSDPSGPRVTAPENVCKDQGFASITNYGKEDFTLGSLADSTYEYLAKEYILLGGLNDQYRQMYEMAIDKATEVNLFRPMLPRELDVLLPGNYHVHRVSDAVSAATGGEYVPSFFAASSHLACFVGGMFGLGSKIFNRPDDLELAKKLTNGCIWAYESTATGIMPESFGVIACESRTTCAWNESKYNEVLDPNPEGRFKAYNAQMAVLDKDEKQEALEVAAAQGDINAKVEMEQDRRHRNAAASKGEKEAKVQPPPVAEEVVPGAVGKIAKRQNIAPAKEAAKEDFAEIAGKTDLKNPSVPGTAMKPTTPAGTVTKWRPEQPKSHEEYVKARIALEKLPPGMVNVLDRRYILRYVFTIPCLWPPPLLLFADSNLREGRRRSNPYSTCIV